VSDDAALWRDQAIEWQLRATALGEQLALARTERDRLRVIAKDITDHAAPIAEDDDGFVAVGYTVSIGAIHRALAALQGSSEIAGLMSKSSLATPGAKALRERTPPDVVHAIVRASEEMARAEHAEAERDRFGAALVILSEPPNGFDCAACRLSADIALSAIRGEPTGVAEVNAARLQNAFDRIALDPAEYRHALGHVADCDYNCEECRDLARHALDGGVDAQERAANILAERDRLQTIVDAIQGYLAIDADQETGAHETVADLRDLLTEIDTQHGATEDT
jgi:hypothetical protein